jgi:hypothetical protein
MVSPSDTTTNDTTARAQVAVIVMLLVRNVVLIPIRCIPIAWRRGEGSRRRTEGGAFLLWE